MLGPLGVVVARHGFASEVSRAAQRDSPGDWENYPASRLLFAVPSARFQRIRLRQNAQGKGRAEGSILKQPAKELSSIKMQKRVNIRTREKGAINHAYQNRQSLTIENTVVMLLTGRADRSCYPVAQQRSLQSFSWSHGQ